MEKTVELYERITNENLLVRRVTVCANHVINESDATATQNTSHTYEQLDIFTDYKKLEAERAAEEARLAREKRLQQAMINIKSRFGKNAVLKGMNLMEGATTIERNGQVGGHRAGSDSLSTRSPRSTVDTRSATAADTVSEAQEDTEYE